MQPRIGWIASIAAWIGAGFIYFLIWLFGRRYHRKDIPWLTGPLGGPVIGDATYREVGEAEGLLIERHVSGGGLLTSLDQLHSTSLNAATVHPRVREFYEHTSNFVMDVWSQTYFPAKLFLWLLVKTISRQVNQLNFPLSPLDTARGIVSEIIAMRTLEGETRYTGWFRTFAGNNVVLYTGFYMTAVSPSRGVPCMKVVFPMPNGNATVLLQPGVSANGNFILDSSGYQFGDAGFYRIQAMGTEHLRVWHIKSLKERFVMYVDKDDTLRCDHHIRFLGLPAISLHYKIVRKTKDV